MGVAVGRAVVCRLCVKPPSVAMFEDRTSIGSRGPLA